MTVDRRCDSEIYLVIESGFETFSWRLLLMNKFEKASVIALARIYSSYIEDDDSKLRVHKIPRRS